MMKTAEQIVSDRLSALDFGHSDPEEAHVDPVDMPQFITDALRDGWFTGENVIRWMREAIEADRAQRQPEVYIVQNDQGEVVDVFRDADEASAAYQYTASGAAYSIIEETVWEPGQYADVRVAELSAFWRESTGDNPDDYVLSEDDWKAGLGEQEAAEIARLIEYQKEQSA